MKLVSVILPYYKKIDFIKKTIKSILNQKYKNFEIILIYDDSNLGELDFLKKIEKKTNKIKLIINKKNLGPGLSRNKGILLSRGTYIAFCDADDIWKKNKLNTQYNFMKKNNIKISHTSYNIIDSEDKIIGIRPAKKIQNYKDLISSCDIGLSSVMLKKEILKNQKFPKLITKEDYSLWLNLSKKYTIYGINSNLVKWRKTEKSLSSNNVQKLKDAFTIYYHQENCGFINSIIKVLVLSMNFLKKNIKT